VSNKIKIGERGFEAPFRYDENKKAIVDANGQNFCFPTYVIKHDVPVIGAFIVSALNDREEWNKVEDGLPKKDKTVLITTNYLGGKPSVSIGYIGADGRWRGRGYKLLDKNCRVIAWAKLPAAYTE
jgi:hypothetical protein